MLELVSPETEADMRAEVEEEEALIALRRLSDAQVDSVLGRYFATRKLYRIRMKMEEMQRKLPF